MADGDKFLAENKLKDGVITLPSGLQYKVLEEGAGLEHPLVSTPCACHYAGRLIDGTEFDSSYKRGTPTTFAPNQVIKGWTEAMQLMVQGDKWEMVSRATALLPANPPCEAASESMQLARLQYIPWQLAYGAAGKPPKIPAKACLVFVMEIMKIKGETKPKALTFPEWSADELALWTEKDESACVAWRESRSAKWEAGDEKLKASYPERAALDAWLDKQCANSKNKSLWKRTRTAKKKAAAAAAGDGLAPAVAKAGVADSATLNVKTARELLDKIMAKFREPATKETLQTILKEIESMEDTVAASMAKMNKLLPTVQTLLGPSLAEYGFAEDELMTVGMTLMNFGHEDATLARDTQLIMKWSQGDFSDL